MKDTELLKEELNTTGESTTDDEKAELKKEMIKKVAQNEDLELDNQSDEQLDDLLIKLLKSGEGNIKDSIDNIFEAMEAVDSDPVDYVEALRVNLNLKMHEAKEIYLDKISEKKTTKIDRVYETLGLKDKEEILNNNEPENVEPTPLSTEYTDKIEDPIESLKNQKGEKIN